jgi:hypothetical protein
MFMASAGRSQRATPPDEARAACPVCGGQIHPIAGRCKHCRADLVKLRGRARPAPPAVLAAAFTPRGDGTPSPFAAAGAAPGAPPDAGAPLPQIAAPAQAPADGTAPAAMPQAAAAIAPSPVLYELPPLPTARSRWPLLVAIAAGVAIIVCLALLLTGDDEAAAGGAVKKRAAPAPDRMDTQPAPPQPRPPAQGNPWGSSPGPQGTAPDAPDDPPDDPLAVPSTPPPRRPAPPPGGAAPAPDQFYTRAFEVACVRLAQCPGMDSIGDFCSLAGILPGGDDYAQRIRAGQCTYDEHAAQRCLAGLQSMPCLSGGSLSLDLSQLEDLFGQFSSQLGDCATALQCQ